MFVCQTSGKVTVVQGDTQGMQKEEGGREERGEESMFRLPYGKGSIEAQAPFRAAVGGRAPVTVKTTVPSQCHHTASWALHWSAAIGMATFALWGCSANVRL